MQIMENQDVAMISIESQKSEFSKNKLIWPKG